MQVSERKSDEFVRDVFFDRRLMQRPHKLGLCHNHCRQRERLPNRSVREGGISSSTGRATYNLKGSGFKSNERRECHRQYCIITFDGWGIG